MKAYFEAFYRYRYLLKTLVQRDLKVKYRRSFLGYLWSILNPLLMMIVLTTVFSTLFRSNIEYFPVYYLTGSLIFNFYSEATTGALGSVLGASSLIKKVYIPKYIFPVEKCLFSFVNMLFSLVAVVIIIVVTRMPVTWTILLFPIPMIYTLIFSLGMGLILASLNVFLRDLGHLYGVLIMAWMYLTPIIYPVDILSEGMQRFMTFNPMYYYVTYFRNLVMYGVIPDLATNLICIIIGLVSVIIGLIVFKKAQDKFILYI